MTISTETFLLFVVGVLLFDEIRKSIKEYQREKKAHETAQRLKEFFDQMYQESQTKNNTENNEN